MGLREGGGGERQTSTCDKELVWNNLAHEEKMYVNVARTFGMKGMSLGKCMSQTDGGLDCSCHHAM